MKAEFGRALVTGASSGIGLAVCSRLAARGAAVLMLARTADRLEKAADGLRRGQGGETKAAIATLAVDVSDAKAVRARLPEALSAFGRLDLLVNCAGITHPASFESIPDAVFESIMAVNLAGTWNVTRAALPFLLSGGAIVNLSSFAGLVGIYGYTAYAASKFALVGFSECLRQELRPRGISVSVVCPSDTDTPQLAYEERLKPPETRAISGGAPVLRPEKVAAVLLCEARRGRPLIIPGIYNRLLYLACRFFPGLYRFYADSGIAAARKRTA